MKRAIGGTMGHWPHTRRLRPALEFRSSEVGAVSRRPDVVLRLQLPPAALPEPLAYVVMLSELARPRDRKHQIEEASDRKHQRWKHDQHDQHDQHDGSMDPWICCWTCC